MECVSNSPQAIQLKFQVRDTGIGIPKDKLSQIFEEFVQADTSTTRKYGGTGLGLTITSSLIEMMDGKLNVDSQEGIGSTFEFTLGFPIASQPTLPIVPANFVDVPVLVMARNPEKRESIESILRMWQMKPFCVSNVSNAIKLLKGMTFANQPVKVVLGEFDNSIADRDSDCQCTDLAMQVQMDSEIHRPAFIGLDKSASAERNQTETQSKSIKFVLQPVKHSELRDAISRALEPGVESLTGESVDESQFKGPHKILLAEDNPVNQKLAVGLLSKFGHDITVVGNGRLAIEALAKGDKFDLVLMDVQMPELDGIEATKEIRASNSRFSKIPIIAMTAHALQSDRQRCLEAGMDEYLSKPFRAKDLFALIEHVLAEHSREWAVIVNTEMAGDVAIDWNQAFDTVGGDRKLLVELIKVFLSEHQNMLAVLTEAIAAKDLEATRRGAHSLKGTLHHLGVRRVAEIAIKLEQLDENEMDQATLLVDDLQKQINQLTAELERFTNS